MVQGLGKLQRQQRLKTESKIVAFLKLQSYLFNELQSISGIRRNSLRDRLDSLVDRKIVVKHVIKNPSGKKLDLREEFPSKVRRGTYYSLNGNNPETKRLLDAYYNDQESKPPRTKELKKEVLTSLEKFRKNIEKEDGVITKQIATFKKEIRPFIDINKPERSMIVWLDSLALYGRHKQLMDKMLKIFAIKLRLKLDYVDRKR